MLRKTARKDQKEPVRVRQGQAGPRKVRQDQAGPGRTRQDQAGPGRARQVIYLGILNCRFQKGERICIILREKCK